MAEIVYRPVILTAKAMFRALGLTLDIEGEQRIPRQGGAVLAVNHTSFLDFIFAGYPAELVEHRLVRFMAKDSVFRHPVAGPLMRGMRHIPVDRGHGTKAYEDAVAYLRAGELVGIFPEATMSRSFDIKELKNGAVRMAAEAGVPLIPMIVFGGHRIMSYGRRDLTRGRTIVITIGEPMEPAAGSDPDAGTEVLAGRLRDLLDASIARYPDDGAGQWWLPVRHGGSAPTIAEAAAIDEQVRAERAARREAAGS